MTLTRQPDESWRDVVARLAGDKAKECLRTYDGLVGEDERYNAWVALYEHDKAERRDL